MFMKAGRLRRQDKKDSHKKQSTVQKSSPSYFFIYCYENGKWVQKFPKACVNIHGTCSIKGKHKVCTIVTNLKVSIWYDRVCSSAQLIKMITHCFSNVKVRGLGSIGSMFGIIIVLKKRRRSFRQSDAFHQF